MDPRAYTPEETELLRRHYPELGAKGMVEQDILPRRSIHSINKKAEKLGLRYIWKNGAIRGEIKPWSARDIEELKAITTRGRRLTIFEISRSLGGRRTARAVESKCGELGLPYQRTQIQPEKDYESDPLCWVCDRQTFANDLAYTCDHPICVEVFDIVRTRPKGVHRFGNGWQLFKKLRAIDRHMAVSAVLLGLIRKELDDVRRRNKANAA